MFPLLHCAKDESCSTINANQVMKSTFLKNDDLGSKIFKIKIYNKLDKKRTKKNLYLIHCTSFQHFENAKRAMLIFLLFSCVSIKKVPEG